MLADITTSLQSYWHGQFTRPVPTCFPGVNAPVGDATSWIEFWIDALNSPPHRDTSAPRLDLLVTLHCFSRHATNLMEAQSIIDEASSLLAHQHIPLTRLVDDVLQTTGLISLREPQVRDLTRIQPAAGPLTRHLVLTLSAVAQFNTPLTNS